MTFGLDLITLIKTVGYIGVGGIVFAETGLLIGFFLPGDSLLFTAGFLASQGYLDITTLALISGAAAVIGDSVGYSIGKTLGQKIFTKENSLFFDPKHIERTKAFYEKHGGKTIILARFVPIIRTFAPAMAGVGRMRYTTFLFFNVIGAVLWGVGVPVTGYYLGSVIPGIDTYLVPIILALIIIPGLPSLIHFLREGMHKKLWLALKQRLRR